MAQYYFIPHRLAKAFPRLQTIGWRLESGLLGALLGIVRLLPSKTAIRVIGGLFALIGPRTPKARKARRNLAVAFDEQNPRQLDTLVRSTFRHLGIAVTELVHLPRIHRDRERRVEFVILPGARPPSPERRCVFVAAHVGAWQLTNLVGTHYGITLPVIYAPESNPYLDRSLFKLRSGFRNPLVASHGGTRVLLRELDKGHSIGMVVDTRLDSGEPLPFFGHDALTNTVPARLALRYQCDLVPVLAERLPDARYRISIHPAIRPTDPQASAAEQALNMSTQLNGLLEQWIRKLPGEWICLKRRWPRAVYRMNKATTE